MGLIIFLFFLEGIHGIIPANHILLLERDSTNNERPIIIIFPSLRLTVIKLQQIERSKVKDFLLIKAAPESNTCTKIFGEVRDSYLVLAFVTRCYAARGTTRLVCACARQYAQARETEGNINGELGIESKLQLLYH